MMDSIFIDNIEPLHQKHINTEYTTMSSDLTLLLNLSSGGNVHPSSLLPLTTTSTTTDTTDLTTTLTTGSSDSNTGSVSSKAFSGSGTSLKLNSISGPRRPSLRNTATAVLDTATSNQALNSSTITSGSPAVESTIIVTPPLLSTAPLSTSTSMQPPRAPALSGAVRLIPDRTVSAHTSSAVNSSFNGISSNSGGYSMVVSSRRMTLSAPVRMPVRPPTAPITIPIPAYTPPVVADVEFVPLPNTATTATTTMMSTSVNPTSREVENRSVPPTVSAPSDVINTSNLNLIVNCDSETNSASVAAEPLSSTCSTRLVYKFFRHSILLKCLYILTFIYTLFCRIQ